MDIEDILTLIEYAREERATVLDLSNRDIDELPAEIGLVSSLKLLNLSYNNITTLPTEIGNLKSLESLLLLRNNIEELPPGIGGLSQIKLLDISHNPIVDFPDEIGQLANLISLDASYCKLEYLPVDFTDLLSLKDLYLENNKFIFPPEKVVKRGLYATMHFLGEEKKRLNARKVNIQTFNMPVEIQSAFSQYVDYFNEMFHSSNDALLTFDVSFISSEEDNLNATPNLLFQQYVSDLIEFFKKNNGEIVEKDKKDSLIDLQLYELSSQVKELTKSLTQKVDEISRIQNSIIELKRNVKK